MTTDANVHSVYVQYSSNSHSNAQNTWKMANDDSNSNSNSNRDGGIRNNNDNNDIG